VRRSAGALAEMSLVVEGGKGEVDPSEPGDYIMRSWRDHSEREENKYPRVKNGDNMNDIIDSYILSRHNPDTS